MTTQSNTGIRRATFDDLDAVVDITKANKHYWTPEVDGKEALARFLERNSNVFLVSDGESEILGFIVGSWDGARAIIHKISVRPDAHGQGVGTCLVESAIDEFKEMGAPTVGVTAADGAREGENDSTGFWNKAGFRLIPAKLMINFDIWDDEDEN